MPDGIAYDDVIDELLKELPEFRPEVEDHREVHGELLPHVLFGDLTRFVLRARDEGRDDLVRRAQSECWAVGHRCLYILSPVRIYRRVG